MQSLLDPSIPGSSPEETSLSIHLPAEYAAWIQAHADRGGTSVSQIIQHLVDAQRSSSARRALGSAPAEAPAEALQEIHADASSPEPSTPKATTPEATTPEAAVSDASSVGLKDTSTTSVVENLRSATERLRDLTNREAALDNDPEDPVHRIEERIKRIHGRIPTRPDATPAPSTSSPATVPAEKDGNAAASDPDAQSMFDMMDEGKKPSRSLRFS